MSEKKYSWSEMCDIMCTFNNEHNYTVKGTEEQMYAVAVITEDSFDEQYTEEERSYMFSSDNKAFIPNQIGNSIFSDCLDGKDLGVRLDWYIPESWSVEYCYIVEDK